MSAPLVAKEGLFVLHLFYQVNRGAWESLSPNERKASQQKLEALLAQIRAKEGYQVTAVALIARADLGFVIVGPDLHVLQEFEKKAGRVLGLDVLAPAFTFFSLTERSEYTTTDDEYAADLQKEGLDPAGPDFAAKMEAFRTRMAKYTHDRLNPKLLDWEFFAFYPMSKRRAPGQNWYSLDSAKRKELMKGHAAVGRKYSGKIAQIITGSTGLDDWEWGVTLFAHDPYEVKAIVYEMRFDVVSAEYAEFGDFYTGTILPLPALFQRLGL